MKRWVVVCLVLLIGNGVWAGDPRRDSARYWESLDGHQQRAYVNGAVMGVYYGGMVLVTTWGDDRLLLGMARNLDTDQIRWVISKVYESRQKRETPIIDIVARCWYWVEQLDLSAEERKELESI